MAGEQESIAIPLVEERLVTDKRTVETGRVRVRTIVEEREELVREALARETVDIIRVPRNQEVAEPPKVREEGDTTIIPVVEEKLVVTKKLVLVEEIHLRRKAVWEAHEKPVTVRSERAVVEREGSSGEISKRSE